MVMKEAAFRAMLEVCPSAPPEVGGLLGSTEKGVVDWICFDAGAPRKDRNQYVPDTGILNAVLTAWEDEGIRFVGIWHTHPAAQAGLGLSVDDRSYIAKIQQAMPEKVAGLNFPVVIPENQTMEVFWARKGEAGIVIEPEALVVT